jgi:hypothetical protein
MITYGSHAGAISIHGNIGKFNMSQTHFFKT